MAEVAGSAPVAGGGGDSSSAEGMAAEVLAAAEQVRTMGLAMTVVGYEAQAKSKHP